MDLPRYKPENVRVRKGDPLPEPDMITRLLMKVSEKKRQEWDDYVWDWLNANDKTWEIFTEDEMKKMRRQEAENYRKWTSRND